VEFVGLPSRPQAANLLRMNPAAPNRDITVAADVLPPATCDQSARGRRDRALLLFGFVGAR
jgi:hypothetical protein